MSVQALLNVSLLPHTRKDAVVEAIKSLPYVENVQVVSKVLDIYVAPGSPVTPSDPLDVIDLVVHISARSFKQVTGTVVDIRNASDRIQSTVTSFAIYGTSKKGRSKAKAGGNND